MPNLMLETEMSYNLAKVHLNALTAASRGVKGKYNITFSIYTCAVLFERSQELDHSISFQAWSLICKLVKIYQNLPPNFY